MKLLFVYLRNYKPLIALALVLATINQVFSLLDPHLSVRNRRVRDPFQGIHDRRVLRGVSLLLGAAVGVAFVSRVARTSRTT